MQQERLGTVCSPYSSRPCAQSAHLGIPLPRKKGRIDIMGQLEVSATHLTSLVAIS